MEYIIAKTDSGLATPKDYQNYFEMVFAKAMAEAMRNNSDVEDYTKEDARQEATYHFLNDSTDYDAVAGMYIGYASGDVSRALKDFKDEIVDEPSERDSDIIAELEKILIRIGSEKFKKLDAKYLKNGDDRTQLSEKDEKTYVNRAFKIYEEVGFESVLPDVGGLNDEEVPYIGKPFKVTGRCKAPEWDLECLPAWNIEFEDGHKMEAYPEEICILEREQR